MVNKMQTSFAFKIKLKMTIQDKIVILNKIHTFLYIYLYALQFLQDDLPNIILIVKKPF